MAPAARAWAGAGGLYPLSFLECSVAATSQRAPLRSQITASSLARSAAA